MDKVSVKLTVFFEEHRSRNKIAAGFVITAGAVENGTKDYEPGTTGSRKTTAV